MSAPVLEFKIRKVFPDFELEVEAAFEEGITSIFGPNGSGKTTILNCIAGLVTPNEGHVQLQERMLYSSTQGINQPPEKRRIGYLFQESSLFPHLGVRQNILYGYNLTPPPQRKIDPQHLLEILSLSHLQERRVGEISGGEAQRVALARVLATSPDLLLLDEPLASLDIALRGIALRYLREIWREFSIPMVFVSHSISEVMALANTMLVMSNGRRVDYGPTRQLLSHPNVYSVDEYSALENILEGEVVASPSPGGLAEVKVGDVCMTVQGLASEPGAVATISIRAGDIILSPDKPSRLSARNTLRGLIQEIHVVGETVLVYADVGVSLVATITPAALRELDLSAGQDVYLIIKTNSVMVLDPRE